MPRPLETPGLKPLLLAALLGAAGCRGSSGPAATPPPASAAAKDASAGLSVRMVQGQAQRFAPRVVASGTLKPQSTAMLAMAVPGRLEKIAVVRGAAVREGDLIASLDAAAAQATLAQARAGVKASEAQLRIAEDGLARLEQIKGREGGVTEAQLTQTRLQRDQAEAGLLNARAQLQSAEVHLRNHHLRAPFSGTITRVPDGVGLFVGPGAPLFALESTGTLTLETSVTQEEAAGIAAGSKVRVSVGATGASTGEATVRLVLPSVDPMTNRVPVEIAVPNADGRFKAFAFARAEFEAGAERDALRIAATAVVQREGGYAIWVAGSDGRAAPVRVRLLGNEGESAIIEPVGAAVVEGTRIIDLPPLAVAEGVQLVEGR